MVRVRRLAGWSMAMTRWHDETGTFHLMAVGEDGLVGPVCGSRAYSFSNAAHKQPPYGHTCRTCAKVQRRLQQAASGTTEQEGRRACPS
jgi:hypothetical protein